MKALKTEAKVENLQQVLGFLEEYLEEMNCPPRLLMQLQIALEELYTNICFYAYEPLTGDALVVLDHNKSVLKVYLIDHGIPFDPTAKEDPDIYLDAAERPIGGLGIYMVKQIVDRMDYSRVGDMNILCLTKDLNREIANVKI